MDTKKKNVPRRARPWHHRDPPPAHALCHVAPALAVEPRQRQLLPVQDPHVASESGEDSRELERDVARADQHDGPPRGGAPLRQGQVLEDERVVGGDGELLGPGDRGLDRGAPRGDEDVPYAKL